MKYYQIFHVFNTLIFEQNAIFSFLVEISVFALKKASNQYSQLKKHLKVSLTGKTISYDILTKIHQKIPINLPMDLFFWPFFVKYLSKSFFLGFFFQSKLHFKIFITLENPHIPYDFGWCFLSKRPYSSHW